MAFLYDYVTGSASLAFSGSIPVPAIGSDGLPDSVVPGFRALADRTAVLSASYSSVSSSVTIGFTPNLATMSGSAMSTQLDLSSSYTVHDNIFNHLENIGGTQSNGFGIDVSFSDARFTVAVDGYYLTSFRGQFTNIDPTQELNIAIAYNGTVRAQQTISSIHPVSASVAQVNISHVNFMVSGSYVDFRLKAFVTPETVFIDDPYASIHRIY